MARLGIVGQAANIAIATGLFLNRRKKKEEAAEASRELQDAEVISMEHGTAKFAERTCPNCGSVDSSGAERCPMCYEDMEHHAGPEDI